MKLLLVYPPFCSPSTVPYSISYIKAFVKDNSNINVKCLDLNAKFHKLMFKEHYDKLNRLRANWNNTSYADILTDFTKKSIALYKRNHGDILAGKKPDFFNEMLDIILKEKPDYVGFSLVYNSQCFYIHPLIDELKKHNIKCLAGGPSVNDKVREKIPCLANEIELVEFLDGKKDNYSCATVPDFSDYLDEDYLAKEITIPLKSSSSCYYKQCAFCTHHSNKSYYEIPLDLIKKSIVTSKRKYFFFIDDMISKKRLNEIVVMVKPFGIKWWCQLRPTKELLGQMQTLFDSGLNTICWGVESGSQKILDKMHKGTKVEDISAVLKESASVGIKNTVFIMFGFPTESKDDFIKTINFLKENTKSIHLASTSIFGLQKGSKTYENPEDYGIYDIQEEKRTKLDVKISFKVKEGLSKEDAILMRKKYTRSIKNIDKLPRAFNYFREQVMLL